MEEFDKKLAEIKITDHHKYPKLSEYKGLLGKLPCRADTTFVGVEVELEQVYMKHHVPGSWTKTEDGSLKDDGAEFVTIPIQFRFLEVELQRLFGSMEVPKISGRCSVHVHLNSRDFTLLELKSFLMLYMIFERSLYRYSGDRWNNNFCVPLFFDPFIVRSFIKSLNNFSYIPDGAGSWFKYFGLNLCPLYGGESTKIGTVEFRHMKGNTDVAWIINWINLIVSLKISAKKFAYDELLHHLETMNTTSGYFWLAGEVFKEHAGLIIDQPTFRDDVEMCISQCKTVFLPVKEGSEVIIKKGA